MKAALIGMERSGLYTDGASFPLPRVSLLSMPFLMLRSLTFT